MKVLILNHKPEQCGVYEFGLRIYNLVKNSTQVEYHYKELGSIAEYYQVLKDAQPDYIIYNWYPCTMSWMEDGFVIDHPEYKHYFIFHDGHIRHVYDKYLFFGTWGRDINIPQCNIPEGTRVLLPRPLMEYSGEYPKNEVFTIGSFGLGLGHKGFQQIVGLVNKEFSDVVLNLQMPNAHFGDADSSSMKQVEAWCMNENINPSIKLNITHNYLSTEELLKFLASNDINIFLYGTCGQGLSSTLDYALSVKRPLAINSNMMFKHVVKDEIIVEKNTIMEIYNRGIEPLQEYYDRWSTKNFAIEFDKLFKGEDDVN